MITEYDLWDALGRITFATSMETAWHVFQEQMAEFGFDRILYASSRLRVVEGQLHPADLHDALVLSNHSQDYLDEFFGKNHYLHAPNVRWVSHNTGAVSWRETAEAAAKGKLNAKEMAVVNLNTRHGIVAGYTLSFPEASSRAVGGMGISASSLTQDAVDAIWSASGHVIKSLAGVAHLKFNDLPYKNGPTLTPRQREALQLIAEGKTIAEVAAKMGRTERTVEKHLRLARQAMNADTTAQAILKASAQNQFFHVNHRESRGKPWEPTLKSG